MNKTSADDQRLFTCILERWSPDLDVGTTSLMAAGLLSAFDSCGTVSGGKIPVVGFI